MDQPLGDEPDDSADPAASGSEAVRASRGDWKPDDEIAAAAVSARAARQMAVTVQDTFYAGCLATTLISDSPWWRSNRAQVHDSSPIGGGGLYISDLYVGEATSDNVERMLSARIHFGAEFLPLSWMCSTGVPRILSSPQGRIYDEELAPLERQLQEEAHADAVAQWLPATGAMAVFRDRPAQSATTAEMLASIRDRLGFTWDQMARMFNVSRRTEHLWAAGGKMAASKEELLREVYQVVRGLPGETHEERRGAFMNPRGELDSYWAELSRRARRGSEINGPALTAAQALGPEADSTER